MKLVKKIKTAIAAMVVLAVCASAGLFAADTNVTATPNIHKGIGSGGSGTWATGWYGPGHDGGTGYFNPRSDQLNPYPYYNIVGGEAYGPLYQYDLPDQNESPLNPQAALTRHGVAGPRQNNVNDRMSSLSSRKKAARVVPVPEPQNQTPAPN